MDLGQNRTVLFILHQDEQSKSFFEIHDWASIWLHFKWITLYKRTRCYGYSWEVLQEVVNNSWKCPNTEKKTCFSAQMTTEFRAYFFLSKSKAKSKYLYVRTLITKNIFRWSFRQFRATKKKLVQQKLASLRLPSSSTY